jgi:hypothetical protein
MSQLSMFEQPKPFHWQRPTEPDICKRKHGGNPQSVQANRRVQKERDRDTVLNLVAMAGPEGRTLDEVAAILDVAPNRISGRFTELKKDGKLIPTGCTRNTRTGSPAMSYRKDSVA